MYATAYNTGSSPVTVDDEGRQVHGGDWGTVETTHDAVKAAIAAGTLVLVDAPGPDAGEQHPDATAAFARTAAIADRAERLQDLDKDVLTRAATAADVPDAGDLSKPALVAALAVRTDTPVPAPAESEAEDDDVASATEDNAAIAGDPATEQSTTTPRRRGSHKEA